MKKSNKKIVVASALVAGAVAGGATMVTNHSVSATSADSNGTTQQEAAKTHERPELSEEKKAEIKAKLENMSEEEKQAWKESHKKGQRDAARHEKPANMTDEEWEQKKTERKAKLEEKLNSMTEEEKQAWLESHKRPKSTTSENAQQ